MLAGIKSPPEFHGG